MPKRVFVSFDYDHDLTLKTFLVGQSKLTDSPFALVDASVKEHLTGDWKQKVKDRISRADLVVVLCGAQTHTATGVAEELRITKELKKEYFLLAGYPDKTCFKPTSADSGDTLYKWTWDNLKKLIGGAR